MGNRNSDDRPPPRAARTPQRERRVIESDSRSDPIRSTGRPQNGNDHPPGTTLFRPQRKPHSPQTGRTRQDVVTTRGRPTARDTDIFSHWPRAGSTSADLTFLLASPPAGRCHMQRPDRLDPPESCRKQPAIHAHDSVKTRYIRPHTQPNTLHPNGPISPAAIVRSDRPLRTRPGDDNSEPRPRAVRPPPDRSTDGVSVTRILTARPFGWRPRL